MKSTREKWRGERYDFYLLRHERLYVFRKLGEGERISQFKKSMGWPGRPARQHLHNDTSTTIL
jgi:hypothetical protein